MNCHHPLLPFKRNHNSARNVKLQRTHPMSAPIPINMLYTKKKKKKEFSSTFSKKEKKKKIGTHPLRGVIKKTSLKGEIKKERRTQYKQREKKCQQHLASEKCKNINYLFLETSLFSLPMKLSQGSFSLFKFVVAYRVSTPTRTSPATVPRNSTITF